MRYFIGVDIGGTSIKAGLVSERGTVRSYEEFPTVEYGTSKDVVGIIKLAISSVKKGRVAGIGIGCPGPLNYKTGFVYNPLNLKIKNVNLVGAIKNKFGGKVKLDNDANCFTLAEATVGAGRTHENVVGVTLGSGTGGGFCINKEIYHGRGNASEIGHATIKFDEKKERYFNPGCFEYYTAAEGLTEIFGCYGPRTIYNLALEGNKDARNAFSDVGEYLGIGLANLMYTHDPDIIIMGGKISKAFKFFKESMHKELTKRYFAKPCPVVESKLDYAGVIGAALLCR